MSAGMAGAFDAWTYDEADYQRTLDELAGNEDGQAHDEVTLVENAGHHDALGLNLLFADEDAGSAAANHEAFHQGLQYGGSVLEHAHYQANENQNKTIGAPPGFDDQDVIIHHGRFFSKGKTPLPVADDTFVVPPPPVHSGYLPMNEARPHSEPVHLSLSEDEESRPGTGNSSDGGVFDVNQNANRQAPVYGHGKGMGIGQVQYTFGQLQGQLQGPIHHAALARGLHARLPRIDNAMDVAYLFKNNWGHTFAFSGYVWIRYAPNKTGDKLVHLLGKVMHIGASEKVMLRTECHGCVAHNTICNHEYPCRQCGLRGDECMPVVMKTNMAGYQNGDHQVVETGQKCELNPPDIAYASQFVRSIVSHTLVRAPQAAEHEHLIPGALEEQARRNVAGAGENARRPVTPRNGRAGSIDSQATVDAGSASDEAVVAASLKRKSSAMLTQDPRNAKKAATGVAQHLASSLVSPPHTPSKGTGNADMFRNQKISFNIDRSKEHAEDFVLRITAAELLTFLPSAHHNKDACERMIQNGWHQGLMAGFINYTREITDPTSQAKTNSILKTQQSTMRTLENSKWTFRDHIAQPNSSMETTGWNHAGNENCPTFAQLIDGIVRMPKDEHCLDLKRAVVYANNHGLGGKRFPTDMPEIMAKIGGQAVPNKDVNYDEEAANWWSRYYNLPDFVTYRGKERARR